MVRNLLFHALPYGDGAPWSMATLHARRHWGMGGTGTPLWPEDVKNWMQEHWQGLCGKTSNLMTWAFTNLMTWTQEVQGNPQTARMGADHSTKRTDHIQHSNLMVAKTTLDIHCGVHLTLRAWASTLQIPLQMLHKFVKQNFITAAGTLFRTKK